MLKVRSSSISGANFARVGSFMEFALSAPAALERVKFIADASLILILSDINMPARWMGKRGDGHWPPATAPILDSTEPDQSGRCLYG